jgi:hypothetical protein
VTSGMRVFTTRCPLARVSLVACVLSNTYPNEEADYRIGETIAFSRCWLRTLCHIGLYHPRFLVTRAPEQCPVTDE